MTTSMRMRCWHEMQKLTLNEGRQPCKVAIHAWDDLVWARGAAALALSA